MDKVFYLQDLYKKQTNMPTCIHRNVRIEELHQFTDIVEKRR